MSNNLITRNQKPAGWFSPPFPHILADQTAQDIIGTMKGSFQRPGGNCQNNRPGGGREGGKCDNGSLVFHPVSMFIPSSPANESKVYSTPTLFENDGVCGAVRWNQSRVGFPLVVARLLSNSWDDTIKRRLSESLHFASSMTLSDRRECTMHGEREQT